MTSLFCIAFARKMEFTLLAIDGPFIKASESCDSLSSGQMGSALTTNSPSVRSRYPSGSVKTGHWVVGENSSQAIV
jgi:hypothetical protein